MPAITTEYYTTSTGAGRIRVKSHAKRGTSVPWNHNEGITENHVSAARAHAAKLNWHGDWHGSGMGFNGGMVFVLQVDKLDGFTI